MAGIGRFVAVGNSDNDVSNIGYSSDGGVTWTVPANPTGLFRGDRGRAVAYGDGTFVAVGDSLNSDNDVSNIGYSSDGGETWTVAANPDGLFRGSDGYGIAYGLNQDGTGVFVAVGDSTNDVSNIGFSLNGGETWTVAENPNGLFFGGFGRGYAAAYGLNQDGSGVFVAVGRSANDLSNIGYSSDGGVTWTVAANPDGLFFGGYGGYGHGIAYGLNQDGSGVFVAVGSSANDLSNIGFSTDGGETWTVAANPNGLFFGGYGGLAIAYGLNQDGSGVFVAAGHSSNDASNIGYSSDGGVTWTVVTPADQNGLLSNGGYGYGIAYGLNQDGSGVFVAVGYNNYSDVSNIGYSSDGGVMWTVVTPTDRDGLFYTERAGQGIAFGYATPPPNPISNICFPAGTPIKTDQGIFPIEKLQRNNNKYTINKYTINKQPIQHITKTVTQDTHLICFEQHALGPNVPSEKTIMTKEHKILFEGQYKSASQFLNLTKKVTKVKYNGELLYNVLLANYGTLQVNNLVCETLHPDNLIAKLYNNYKEAERPDLVCQLNASLLERDAKKYKAVERKILHK